MATTNRAEDEAWVYEYPWVEKSLPYCCATAAFMFIPADWHRLICQAQPQSDTLF